MLSPKLLKVSAVVILALGFVSRLYYIFFLNPPEANIYSDMKGYSDIAGRILQGSSTPYDFFQPIGYATVLAFSLWLDIGYTAIKWMHIIAGLGAVVLSWRASEKLLGKKLGLLVLLVLSFHVPFILLSGYLLAETLYTFLIALLFYLLATLSFPWTPKQGFLLGVLVMGATFFKGTHVFVLPLFGLWLVAWSFERRSELSQLRTAWKSFVAMLAGVVLMSVCHAAFSYHHDGKLRFGAAETGGMNLVEGKCPDKQNSDINNYSWTSPLFIQTRPINEKKWGHAFHDQSFFWQQGLKCIADDPWVLAESFNYVGYLFYGNQLWPSIASSFRRLNEWYGILFTFLFFPGIVMGFVLMARKPTSARNLPFLLALACVMVAYVLKSELRYRVPFDVAFIPLSFLGWRHFLSRKILHR